MKRIAIPLLLTLVAVACSTETTPRTGTTPPATTSPSASPSASPTGTMQVTVYYLVAFKDDLFLAPERHRVPKTAAVARAALEELVHGTAQDADHTTPFPAASKINSVTINGDVATVDWSAEVLEASVGAKEEALGFQSAVYTLTESPTIKTVRFTVEGKDRGAASNGRMIEDWWGHVGLAGQPWDRDPAVDVLEPVTVFAPLDGASAAGTLRIAGEAAVFEANVSIVLRDATGKAITRTFATASAGAPARGSFAKTITFTPPVARQNWTLQVFETSAEDGSVSFMEDRSIQVG